jgi:aquaporin Z
VNPARTLGPDIVSGECTGWWVYVVGDIVGAVIAVVLIILVRGIPRPAEREAAEGRDVPAG